jgi:hypothetical protein
MKVSSEVRSKANDHISPKIATGANTEQHMKRLVKFITRLIPLNVRFEVSMGI